MPATAKKKAKSKPDEYVGSEQALALALGYKNRTTVQHMRSHPEAPEKSKQGYHVESWKKFDLEVWRPSRVKHAKSEENSEYAKERLRKIKLENEEREIKNRKARGDLMSKDEVCSVIGEAFSGMVAELNQQSNDVAPEVAGLEVKEAMSLLKDKNKTVLQNFALGKWAKKKVFWQDVYAEFQSLQATLSLGNGANKT